LLFQTAIFVLLFIGTLVVFYRFPQRFRLPALGVSSLLFYAASGLIDFVLLITVISVSYQLSLRVRPGGPKWPLVAGILLLFGSLAYFKYGGFLYENANHLLAALDIPSLPRFGGAVLPLGISFYTFQIVAYLVDVYKGRADSGVGFLRYIVFIMFFGQLIAGPIMRGSEYLGQLTNLKGANRGDVQAGVSLILLGLVKKVLIADSIAGMVDTRFADYGSLSQSDAWIAAYLFAFQIFFDFSGYVNIALGLGRLLGMNLSENFRTPYLSRGPAEFWGRWHITLSQWFRDYLYIPLGGNRGGRFREVANLLAVMVIAGLWHGAGWQFAIWGAVHGIYLVVGRSLPSDALRRLLPLPSPLRERTYDAISVFIFFHLTVLAWIPFRSPDLPTTVGMLTATFRPEGIAQWVNQIEVLALILGLFGLHIAERIVTEFKPVQSRADWPVPRVAIGVAAAAVVLIILMTAGSTSNDFIYFRF
jgi:alginate O-acetyltransferase complex protein AlgI